MNAETPAVPRENAPKGNLVVYLFGGISPDKTPILKPLFSCDANDSLAQVKIIARVGNALTDSDKRGVPHDEIRVVREYREADEGGKLTHTEYAFYEPVSGADGKTSPSLTALFSTEGK